jgi:CO/xanthine dehydrogenase FAD-binding subunit
LKPPVFGYHAPRDVDEVLALLAEHGEDGKLLAGGQSLIPLLNFRIAHPDPLIDLNRTAGLSGIRRADGALRIGTMTRHSTLEHSTLVAERWPLLTDAIKLVAHMQIRNRGTVGGSVAHADPSAELPVAMAAADARMHVRSARGARTIEAADFFVNHLMTTMEPDELLVEIEVPPMPARTGHAFVEFARRHGDFALAGAAVLLTVDEAGTCRRASIALLAAAPTPFRVTAAEQLLVGATVDQAAAEAAADLAVEAVDPTGDIHGSTEYRKDLIRALVRRGIVAAAERAAALTDSPKSGG